MNWNTVGRLAVILAVFGLTVRSQALAVLVPGYSGLYESHPYYVPEGLRSLAEIALVVLALVAVHRYGGTAALGELGLLGRPWRGLAFGMAAALPMWAVFALAVPVAQGVDAWEAASRARRW